MSDFEYALDYFKSSLPSFYIYPGYERDGEFDLEICGEAIYVYLTIFTDGKLKFHVTDFATGDKFETGEGSSNYRALQIASKELEQVYQSIRTYPLV